MSTKGGKRKGNGSQVMDRVWCKGKRDARKATSFTADPLGPSSDACTAGDATRKPRWNDVPILNHGTAAVACFSYLQNTCQLQPPQYILM